jgi:two-component system, OmpR family, sensor histidine kinase BaeS
VNTGRPLDGVTSIKLKLGLLVGASVSAALLVAAVGASAGVPLWMGAPVTLAAALTVTLWLARGMTAPLREMTAAAQAMAGGDYTRAVTATSSDEVGLLARAFTAMAADLAGADRQRRELVATVSHELRTPLAAQRALLENLVDGVAQPDDAALRTALRQSERLSDLVADLLDLSRIDAGAAPLRLGDVRLADLLLQVAAEAGLAGRDVEVTTEVSPPGLTVRADPARLAQLVGNLVDNAVRHSPPGGRVQVRAASGGAAADGAGEWTLEVGDDGPGIPADRAARVFDRFGGGDGEGGGTGLGLAIARWVCALHGGTIDVVLPAAGARGATIRAVLPLESTPARPMVTHPEAPTSQVIVPSIPVVEVEEHIVSPSPSSPAFPAPAPIPPAPLPLAPLPLAPLPPPPPAAAHPYGGAPLLDQFWPEHRPAPRPGVALAALGVGVFAALTWPGRDIGLATTATMLAAGVLMWAVARHRTERWTVGCGVLAAALAGVAAVRASGGVVTVAVLAGVLVAAVGLTGAHGLLAMVWSAVAWPVSALRGLPLLARTIAAAGRFRLLWPVLRTAALSLVVLAVFGALFATGDAVFGSWAAAVIPDLSWGTLVVRAFVLVLVGGVTLTGAYLAINPPNVDRVRIPDGRPRATWEWAVPVGVVVALFAGVLLAQAVAMWGGRDYLRRTTGLTYAEYVHQGFGQLTVATFLTVIVVAVTVRVAGRSAVRDRMMLRGLVGMLCLLTLAVVASALYRMDLYQDAFGYTVLRVFVDGFELWLGVVVGLVLLGTIRCSWAWVPRAVLVSGAVVTLGFAAMNPDAWVADRNIDRYEAGRPLDLSYLASLSPDVVPVVVGRLPEEAARCIVTQVRSEPGSGADWLEWNLGRARADAALRGLGGEPGTADPSSCAALLATGFGTSG